MALAMDRTSIDIHYPSSISPLVVYYHTLVQCMHAQFNVMQTIHLVKAVNTNLQYMYLEKTNSLQTDPHLGVATESIQFK